MRAAPVPRAAMRRVAIPGAAVPSATMPTAATPGAAIPRARMPGTAGRWQRPVGHRPGAVDLPGRFAGCRGTVLSRSAWLREHQELAAGQMLGEPDLADVHGPGHGHHGPGEPGRAQAQQGGDRWMTGVGGEGCVHVPSRGMRAAAYR